jgi:phytoene dehydrogenase-like protein
MSSSPFSRGRRYTTDESESESDEAIQRDIAAADAEVARERQQEDAEAARLLREQRWLWLKSLLPFTGISRVEMDGVAAERRSRWQPRLLLRYLNPMTYLRGIAWLIQRVLDWIMDLVHVIIPYGLWDRLSSIFGFLPHVLAGALAFVVAFALATQLTGSLDRDWASNAVEATMYDIESATLFRP